MISKYIAIVSFSGMAVLSALVWYMNGTITDLNKEIGQIEVQLIACQANNDNLVTGINKQNESIDVFNTILETKNNKLEEIARKNKALATELTEQIYSINVVQHDTCTETINWMLKEAIDENINTIAQ